MPIEKPQEETIQKFSFAFFVFFAYFTKSGLRTALHLFHGGVKKIPVRSIQRGRDLRLCQKD